MDPAFVTPDGDVYYNFGGDAAYTEQESLEAYYETIIEDMPAVPSGFVWSAMLRYEF